MLNTWISTSFFVLAFRYLFTLQEKYPELSAAKAGERRFDVYMGIDVFGRKTFGGGEWSVCQHFSVDIPDLIILTYTR